MRERGRSLTSSTALTSNLAWPRRTLILSNAPWGFQHRFRLVDIRYSTSHCRKHIRTPHLPGRVHERGASFGLMHIMAFDSIFKYFMHAMARQDIPPPPSYHCRTGSRRCPARTPDLGGCTDIQPAHGTKPLPRAAPRRSWNVFLSPQT